MNRIVAFVFVAILAALASFLLYAPDDRPPAATPDTAAPGAAADPGRGRGATAAATPASTEVAAGPATAATPAWASGLTAQQRQQLQDALRDHPDREAELQRVSHYMAYMQTMEQFRQRQAQGAPKAELQALARQLDAGLEQRLQQREMSAAEAHLLKARLLDTLLPDDTQRAAALAQWREQHAPRPAPPDAREARYRAQESALVAAWQAQPPAQRDLKQLQAQLETLRQSVFGNGR